jgi:hypothetical protein
MVSLKVSLSVTPAKAGVQNVLKKLDSGFRRNDKFFRISTFYAIISFTAKFLGLSHIITKRRKQ